ncbi:hypothetical protein EJE24_23735 [Enterobacter huaxiensis]|uniref:Uncharacterized protein n=1 Tax=Enterobacter huaxiensis TaxID=2494702 RepID=A0A3R9N7Q5_9ENTR|nr:hypothetical protein EJE24_23735 [Enterobacter huaxiensis]
MGEGRGEGVHASPHPNPLQKGEGIYICEQYRRYATVVRHQRESGLCCSSSSDVWDSLSRRLSVSLFSLLPSSI